MANQTEKSATLDRPLESERLASLVRSVRILAHEIGNPLNNMYLEALLLERRLRQTQARGAEVTRAAQIVTEIRRLIRLLEEFRQTSPVKAVPMAECDLVEICEYAALHSLQRARAANVHVRRVFSENEVVVNGCSDKLKQVMLNLLKNAIEAMPEGGTLTIGVSIQKKMAVVTVRDTGVGIPEGVDIWKEFQTTKEFGTGLGLVIVKQIIASHHGTINCDSVPGYGTTFSITLPLVAA